MRADILGRPIEVKSQYDVDIVAEANREIAKLRLENIKLIKLLSEIENYLGRLGSTLDEFIEGVKL